jgi:hypothetical protein
MTTLAKIESNRRNGQLSHGPRTPEGKAVVSRNATKHGIFAKVPVLPGESPEQWESHRAGVVESLAPVGLLEVNLAERAALLLWRLQRLARYEAETVASAMEAVDLPPLPEPVDKFAYLNPPPQQKTRDEQLQDLRRELRTAHRDLAEVGPARDYFRALPGPNTEGTVPFAIAQTILETACSHAETAEDLRTDPPAFDSKRFLKKLGLTETDAREVAWTAELIHRGLTFYATCACTNQEPFREEIGAELEDRAEELDRRVVRLEREAAAVAALLDGGSARKQFANLLPTDGRDERIAKYERHLHTLLTSTLHELERLQARRDGEAVPPPLVADVNVTVDTGPA